MEQLLTDVAGAARALSVGKTKIQELTGTGQLVTVTIGRRRLIPVASVEQYYVELLEEARQKAQLRAV